MSKLAERLRGGRATENKKVADVEQFLTFILAGEEYGVEILSVQEIRGWEPVMSIPNAPSYLRGVINLRGVVLPIVDLRTRFGLPTQAESAMTVVIILRVLTGAGERCIGIVVDAVSEVYDVEKANIQAPPDIDASAQMDYISGIATLKNKMVSLIKIEKLFDVERLSQLSRKQ